GPSQSGETYDCSCFSTKWMRATSPELEKSQKVVCLCEIRRVIKADLTPELSRAAKRHRLERLVRPPFPGTCARRAAAQPLRRTVQQAPCLVLPKRTMRAAKNSHRARPEADPASRILRRVAPVRSR